MSCFYFAEQITNKHFSVDSVIDYTVRLIDAGYIDKNLNVYENHEKLNKTKLVLKYIGIPNVKNVVYKEADYICKDKEYEILKLEKPGYGHFVPGNGIGQYSWDSLGIRPQQKNYKLKSKRIIILE